MNKRAGFFMYYGHYHHGGNAVLWRQKAGVIVLSASLKRFDSLTGKKGNAMR